MTSGRGEGGRSEGLRDGTIRIAAHAIYRVFAHETVVLNVKRGTYHGLNPTAGRMLIVLDETDTVNSAIEKLAEEYQVPAEQIEEDITELCHHLLQRGLIEISSGPDGG